MKLKKVLAIILILSVCKTNGQTFKQLTDSAQSAQGKKNYKEALSLYQQALKLDKENWYLFNKISLMYNYLDEVDSSIFYSNLTLQKIPNDTVALYYRGHSYMDKQEYQKALDDFIRSFEGTNKRNSDACFNIGKCYTELGNFNKAIEYFNLTLTLEPNDKYSFYELGYCYASLPTPDKENALKYYNKAIEQDKNYYDPYFNRGLLYSGEPFNNLTKAHQDLERSIEIRPKNKLSYLYNGMLYRQEATEGNEEKLFKARDMFDKVIELYPDYAVAYFERAVTWYKIGILNMVCRDLDKAESLGYEKATEYKKSVCK